MAEYEFMPSQEQPEIDVERQLESPFFKRLVAVTEWASGQLLISNLSDAESEVARRALYAFVNKHDAEGSDRPTLCGGLLFDPENALKAEEAIDHDAELVTDVNLRAGYVLRRKHRQIDVDGPQARYDWDPPSSSKHMVHSFAANLWRVADNSIEAIQRDRSQTSKEGAPFNATNGHLLDVQKTAKEMAVESYEVVKEGFIAVHLLRNVDPASYFYKSKG